MHPVATRDLARRLVMATVALAGFPLGATAMAMIFDDFGWRLLLVGLATTLMSAWAARTTLRARRTPRAALSVGFGVTIVAAVCNAPLSLVFVGFSTFEPEALLYVPMGVFFACIFGVVLTVPLGLAFGAAYAPLFASVQAATRERSLDAGLAVLRICGFWLSLVSTVGYLLHHRLVDAGRVGYGTFSLVAATYVALILAGLVVGGLAHLRLLARRAWVLRVARGRVEGWSLRPLDEVDAGRLAELPRFRAVASPPVAVLMRHQQVPGAGVYRTVDHLEPVALV